MIDLYKVFSDYNHLVFDGQLSVNKLYIVPSLKYKGVWGLYNPKNNQIHINPECFKRGKHFTKKTLFHEMCHLLVKGHGEDFNKLMSKFVVTRG